MYCRIIINIHKTLISVDFEEHLTTWIKMGIACDTMITIFFSYQQVINNSKSLKSVTFSSHKIHPQKFIILQHFQFRNKISIHKNLPLRKFVFTVPLSSLLNILCGWGSFGNCLVYRPRGSPQSVARTAAVSVSGRPGRTPPPRTACSATQHAPVHRCRQTGWSPYTVSVNNR